MGSTLSLSRVYFAHILDVAESLLLLTQQQPDQSQEQKLLWTIPEHCTRYHRLPLTQHMLSFLSVALAVCVG